MKRRKATSPTSSEYKQKVAKEKAAENQAAGGSEGANSGDWAKDLTRATWNSFFTRYGTLMEEMDANLDGLMRNPDASRLLYLRDKFESLSQTIDLRWGSKDEVDKTLQRCSALLFPPEQEDCVAGPSSPSPSMGS